MSEDINKLIAMKTAAEEWRRVNAPAPMKPGETPEMLREAAAIYTVLGLVLLGVGPDGPPSRGDG